MIINAGMDGPDEVGSGFLSATTLGNLANSIYGIDNATSTIVHALSTGNVEIPILMITIPRDKLAQWYTASDIVMVIIFFFSIQWLRYYEAQENLRVTKRYASIEEYTIQVVRVPKNITEYDLAKFFGDLTEEPIADVVIAQDNGDLIDLYVKRGKIIDQLWKMAARIHLLKNERKESPNGRVIKNDSYLNRQIRDSSNIYNRLFAQYQYMTDLRDKSNDSHDALSAFITFETQAGYFKCLDLYPNGFYSYFRQPEDHRLNGMRLIVQPAPPPSTVKWENMGVGWKEKLLRRSVAIFCALFLLGVSFLATYTSVRYRQEFSSQLSIGCEIKDDISHVQQIFDILQNGDAAQAKALNENDYNILECLCKSLDYKETLKAIVNTNSPCFEFWKNYGLMTSYTIAATFIVAIVNQIIEILIQKLGSFEKHNALVDMELSVAKRTFIALFLNTAIVILVVNADFGVEVIGQSTFKDFTTGWYTSVGIQIMLTMIFNAFTMHLYRVGSFLFFKCRKRHNNSFSQRELNELYLGPVFHLSLRTAQILSVIFVTMLYSSGIPALYPIACGSFLLFYWIDKYLFLRFYRTPPNYSNKLNRWASSILWWAAFLHMCFAVWMYSAEGIFSTEVASQGDYASKISSFFGMNISFSSEGYTFERRITLDHIIPILVLIILTAAYKSLAFFFHKLDVLCRFWCCFGCLCSTRSSRRRYLNPNFTDARINGEIRGLDTYNILRNPVYARSFGINDEFSEQHRHITSVRLVNNDHLQALKNSLSP